MTKTPPGWSIFPWLRGVGLSEEKMQLVGVIRRAVLLLSLVPGPGCQRPITPEAAVWGAVDAWTHSPARLGPGWQPRVVVWTGACGLGSGWSSWACGSLGAVCPLVTMLQAVTVVLGACAGWPLMRVHSEDVCCAVKETVAGAVGHDLLGRGTALVRRRCPAQGQAVSSILCCVGCRDGRGVTVCLASLVVVQNQGSLTTKHRSGGG